VAAPIAFAEIAPGDLDIGVVGQLPAAHLALGDALKPGPLQLGDLEAPFRRAALGRIAWKTRGNASPRRGERLLWVR
jgi:hypothetical protein